MRYAAVLLLALAVAGCGDSSDTIGGGPEAAVRDYLAGKGGCSLYSEKYRDLVKRESEGRCKVVRTPGERLLKVEVSGDEATATVSCDDPSASDCSLPLVKEDGRWKLDGSPSPND